MTIRQCADLEVRLGPQRLVVDLIGPPAHGCESGQVSVTGVIIARSRAEVRRDQPYFERRREAGSRERPPLARVRNPLQVRSDSACSIQVADPAGAEHAS
jgi:hypothetical protein